jgi:hypothetical protein
VVPLERFALGGGPKHWVEKMTEQPAALSAFKELELGQRLKDSRGDCVGTA